MSEDKPDMSPELSLEGQVVKDLLAEVLSGQQAVKDITAERGITINNFLSGAILVVMAWVGNSISEIRDDVSEINVSYAKIETKVEAHDGKFEHIEGKVEKNSNRIRSLEIKVQ